MFKYALAISLLVTQAFGKASNFYCTFANGQTLEGWAKDGDIVLDFDGKGDWQKAFGKVQGDTVLITEIVAGGRFVLAWNMNTHEAYAITNHNRTGKQVENHAYCSWR
jgi:hypothetical protein